MPYEVRAADLVADRGDILRLWDGNLREADAARYRWIYDHNPNGAPACWLVTDASGAVGAAAAFPRTIQGAAQSWRAGVSSDFVVDKAHRTTRPALMLQKTQAASCGEGGRFDVLFGFANRAARAVQARAGFTDLGAATDLRKVIRSAAALERRYGALARVAAPVVDAGIALMEWRPHHLEEMLRCSDRATFDSRFDELWARIAPEMPLTGERSSRYLNWRFRDHPHIGYRICVVEHRDTHELAGYLVWYVRDREAIVADVVTDASSASLIALAARVLEHARRLGVDSVRLRYFGAPERFLALQRLGFRASEAGRHVVMRVSPAAQANLPLDRNSWYLLEGDADP